MPMEMSMEISMGMRMAGNVNENVNGNVNGTGNVNGIFFGANNDCCGASKKQMEPTTIMEPTKIIAGPSTD